MLDRLGQAAVAALLLIVAVPVLSASPVGAQAVAAVGGPQTSGDPYSVTGVKVDVTASSAAEARDKAISEAQHKAFEVLFRRIVVDGATRVVPTVSESDLQRMIQGFEIEQERDSAVRYVASMAFKFRSRAVGTYISSLGARLAESPPSVAVSVVPTSVATTVAVPVAPVAAPVSAKPTLVLPLAQGKAAVLWEERTPWRSAWEDFAAVSTTGTPLVPLGELADIADIGANEAVAGDAGSMAKIAGRYNAGLVVVAALAGADLLDTAAGAQVVVSRYGVDGLPAGPMETVVVPGTLGEAVPALLNRTVSAVAAKLAALAQPVAAPVVATAVDVPVLAGVPIRGMADWLEVRRRLTSDPMVTGVDMTAMTRTKVDVAIRYRGDVDGLRAMLDRDGLTLVPTPGGWSIYLKASVAPPVPARLAPAMASPAPVPVGPPGVLTGVDPSQPIAPRL